MPSESLSAVVDATMDSPFPTLRCHSLRAGSVTAPRVGEVCDIRRHGCGAADFLSISMSLLGAKKLKAKRLGPVDPSGA